MPFAFPPESVFAFAGILTHDQTNPGGEVDLLNPGDYGAVLINKAITIDGGAFGSIQVGNDQDGISVIAGSTDVVTLRNLSISGKPNATGGTRGIVFRGMQAACIRRTCDSLLN